MRIKLKSIYLSIKGRKYINFQQQYSRIVITGSFDDLQLNSLCTNKNNIIDTYLLQNRANIKK